LAAIDYPEWRESLEQEVAVAYYDQVGTSNKQGRFGLADITLERYVDEIHTVAAFLSESFQAEVILLGHMPGDNPWADKNQWNRYVNELVYTYYLEKGLTTGAVLRVLFWLSR